MIIRYTAPDGPTNAKRLQVFEKVIAWANQNGLEVNMNKVDYICFIMPTQEEDPPNPTSNLKWVLTTIPREQEPTSLNHTSNG